MTDKITANLSSTSKQTPVSSNTHSAAATQANNTVSEQVSSLDSQKKAKPQADSKATVAYKPINIMVYGKVYSVNCPVGEEDALKQAGKHINDFVQKVRRQAPQLGQEELLVLCCLDMYETLQDLKNKENNKADSAQKALNLVNKMLADTQTMLN